MKRAVGMKTESDANVILETAVKINVHHIGRKSIQ